MVVGEASPRGQRRQTPAGCQAAVFHECTALALGAEAEILKSEQDGDCEGVIERATILKNGKLTERYAYLKNYLEGKE